MSSQAPQFGEEQPAPLLRASDLALTVYLPLMGALSWVLPESLWPRLCAVLVRLSGGARRGVRRRRADIIAEVFRGLPLALEAERISFSLSVHYHVARMQVLRSYRPGGWHPRIEIEGREHLDRALAAGKGAILWIAPFAYNDVVSKLALHRAGFGVIHLSRHHHGLSTSRIGARLLNPIWTHVEEQFLADRVVITDDQIAGPLRRLVQGLRQGNLVSITCGPQGQRCATAPFFGSTVYVAEGAPALALRTKAPLLPLYTVRTADSCFRTCVGAPMQVPSNPDPRAAAEALVQTYTAALAPVVLEWVDQFAGWETMVGKAQGAGHKA